MGRILGIDFGEKRIGIALSDESHFLASPITTLETGKDLNQTLLKLTQFLKSYPKLEAIVIGLPLFLNGKDSPMSLQVREFAKLIKEAINIDVILWDERLTSMQVERSLKEQGFNRKKRSERIDQGAAALILQSYLDSKRT